MRKNDVILPEVAEAVVQKAICDGKIHVERVGIIADNCNNKIAEKMIVFWLNTGITVYRTNAMMIGNFPVISYRAEKYPNGRTEKIIAEIEKLRKEWTSGVM